MADVNGDFTENHFTFQQTVIIVFHMRPMQNIERVFLVFLPFQILFAHYTSSQSNAGTNLFIRQEDLGESCSSSSDVEAVVLTVFFFIRIREQRNQNDVLNSSI